MRYLLDTSALLAHYHQEAGWQQVQALLETDDADILIASVSIAELGRRLREFGAAEAEVEATLANYELLMSGVVGIDTAVAHAAFTVGCRTPQRLPLTDALIAAAAQSAAAVLVHRDAHMLPIPEDIVRQLALSADGEV